MTRSPRSAVLASLAAVACGKASPRDAPPPSATRADASVAVAPIDAPAAVASLDAPPAPIVVDVPVEPAALQTWLVAGHYRAWPHESGRHESAGPHGDAVQTYVAPALVASLERAAPSHPRGAAAVKELFDAAGAHMGWAVSVKVADDSAAGRGWYWYEVFSTAPRARPAYAGVGKKLCRECHETGTDQVLIEFPLQ